MAITTAVPQPTLGPDGYIAPLESAVLAGVTADFEVAFGGNLNPALETPQGQLISSETAIIGDSNDQFLWFTNNVDPAFAAGRMQDAIARIYFITRNPAQPTVVQVLCTGLANVPIPAGALVQDGNGNIYACTEAATIPSTGNITLPFACTVNGPISCPADAILSAPYQSIPGWDSAANPEPGTIGNDVESRAAFAERRTQSVALNAQGSLQSILGAVLEVPDVLDAFVYENNGDDPLTYGGVTLSPHSLYVAVSGGLAQSIGNAIWTKKSDGCNYNGNTEVTVQDLSYNPPYPTYTILYETPVPTPVYFSVVIANSANVPSNALALVQNAIISAFAGGDGGTRARIGSTLYASRYYAPVALLGAWAQILDIQIGMGAQATFTGAIAGTTLTVSAIAAGTLSPGQLIGDSAAHVLPGTTIVSQLGGTTGGTGTYKVSATQSVTSEAMTATDYINSVTMGIAQAPTVQPSGILLVLV